MYINPFLAGILATIGVELVVLVIGAFASLRKEKNSKGK